MTAHGAMKPVEPLFYILLKNKRKTNKKFYNSTKFHDDSWLK